MSHAVALRLGEDIPGTAWTKLSDQIWVDLEIALDPDMIMTGLHYDERFCSRVVAVPSKMQTADFAISHGLTTGGVLARICAAFFRDV
eukprot:8565387-Pyramimonas_sp.AAC.1